ncbi:four-carbon acid sugar kinase family protein [Alteribacillus sp. HJP-4]|uniref:four-carbon acid sugar kinase family protein n=1 Tax=Alteribacillus sp. HJP-4 TaxID=2775394 RepID=UPI0035CD05CA
MKIGIIADDLTGANASGVRLSHQGFRTMTLLHSAAFPANDYNAVVMDTDSRYAKENIAKKRVSQALAAMDKWEAVLTAKRIDSTLRGNVGEELDVMLDHYENSVAVLAPSFPDSGRIVAGGYMLVDNIPLEKTAVSQDPVKPLTQSYVPKLLKSQSRHEVDAIFLEDILKSAAHTKTLLQKKIADGARIIVCDAVSNENLETIAEAMSQLKTEKFIPVDPGPLTAYYAKALQEENSRTASTVLVMVGSATSLTGKQLDYLKEKTAAATLYVNAEKLASYTSSWEDEVNQVTEKALDQLEKAGVLIITTHKPGFGLIDLKSRAKAEGYSEDALAKRIADGLGSIFRKTMEKGEAGVSGCFSSGGDVTASVCSFARANGIELIDEVIPLAAYGKLAGGYFPDLPIVTKGGMIGDETAIYESVRLLQMKAESK